MKPGACDGLSRRLLFCFGEQKASLSPLTKPHDLMIAFMELILGCSAEFTLCNSKLPWLH
jgi:hypothetical protein